MDQNRRLNRRAIANHPKRTAEVLRGLLRPVADAPPFESAILGIALCIRLKV